MSTGIASEACQPYTGVPGPCSFNCVDQTVKYKLYKCKADTFKYLTKPEEIKKEIMTNGPVAMAYQCYDDFMSYSSGVYKVVSPKNGGGHLVACYGWETEAGTNKLIWICKNSWAATWGLSGWFKIYDGEGGIGTAVFACEPDI